jgi:hypothetical protein
VGIGRPKGSRTINQQRFRSPATACAGIPNPETRRLIVALGKKLQSAAKITARDVPGLGMDFARLGHNQTAELLAYTPAVLYQWAEKGAPRNQDGTWDVPALSRWLRDRAEKNGSDGDGSLKDKKTIAEIARLEAQVQKINEETMPRADHERLLVSRSASLRNFWDQTAGMNAYRFVGLTLDEARVRLDNLTREGMHAYVGSRVDEQPAVESAEA